MKIEEFNSKKKALLEKHDEEMFKLKRDYALSNSTVKIGDMVTDHMGTIKVEKVITWCRDIPSCVYKGKEYTKAGKPSKRGSTRNVYQINLITQPH